MRYNVGINHDMKETTTEMTGTAYDRIPKNWRVVRGERVGVVEYLLTHANQWTTDASLAIALTKAEAEGMARIFGGEAVEL